MTDASLKSLPRWQRLCWLAVALLLCWSFGYTEMAGSDLWWHVAGGREILAQGSPWLRDTWSYTAFGERWHNHEWLADLLFYGWSQLLGLSSLVYWKWLLMLLAYGQLFWALERLSGDPAAALILLVLALAVGAPFIDMRPQLYTFAGFATLLCLHLRGAPFWQWALLFLAWANLHGGFVLGLLILPILLFPYARPNWPDLARAARRVLGCTAASALNPDGLQVLVLPLIYALDAASPYRQLGEWLPPWAPGGIRSPLFFWSVLLLPLLLASYALPRLRRAVSLPWWALGLALLTLAMALTSRRFIPFYAMSLVLLAAPLLGHLMRGQLRDSMRAALWAAFALLAAIRLMPYPVQSAPAFHYLTAEYSYPRDTLDVALAAGIAGKVFAYYNWGGYLHLHSDGALRVFIDGRANTVFDDRTYLDYVRVLRADPGWVELVETSGAEYFLWPTAQAGGPGKVQALLQTGRWTLLHQGAVGVLLQRRGGAVSSQPLPPVTGSPWHALTRAQLALWRGELPQAEAQAREVRRDLPWQRNACSVLIQALRGQGREEDAAQVLADCLDYFPTRYLR